jgi:uncharacterized RDD family membrane protein YckC
MSRQDRRPEAPGLFDLPLDAAAEPEERATPRRSAPRAERAARVETPPDSLPLFAPGPAASARRPAAEAPREGRDERPLRVVEAGEARPVVRAGAARRLLAGLGDLALHAAVFVLMLAGARLLGSEITPTALLPTAIGLLLFSLLYTVLPLAFWGQTPGMSFAGIVSSSVDGEPLSFGQSFRLWLASLLAVLFAGLPTIIAPRGRSVSDRLAGARTLPAAR